MLDLLEEDMEEETMEEELKVYIFRSGSLNKSNKAVKFQYASIKL